MQHYKQHRQYTYPNLERILFHIFALKTSSNAMKSCNQDVRRKQNLWLSPQNVLLVSNCIYMYLHHYTPKWNGIPKTDQKILRILAERDDFIFTWQSYGLEQS